MIPLHTDWRVHYIKQMVNYPCFLQQILHYWFWFVILKWLIIYDIVLTLYTALYHMSQNCRKQYILKSLRIDHVCENFGCNKSYFAYIRYNYIIVCDVMQRWQTVWDTMRRRKTLFSWLPRWRIVQGWDLKYSNHVWKTLLLNCFACEVHPTRFASNTCSKILPSPRDNYELDCGDSICIIS